MYKIADDVSVLKRKVRTKKGLIKGKKGEVRYS